MKKHQEWIILEDTGDKEDSILDGWVTIYRIKGFGMGRQTGGLIYDRRGPLFPSNANSELVNSMAAEMPRGPIVRNIFDLDTIKDDEVALLRDERGVKIIIER